MIISKASSICVSGISVEKERRRKSNKTIIRCSRDNYKADSSKGEKVVLKGAWYASELLGIAASFFRPKDNEKLVEGKESLDILEFDAVDRSLIVETIKRDFESSYFVTGAVTLDAYQHDCEFADPAASYKGLARFKRNCTNFGSLVLNSDMKLIKWEDFQDKGIGHWRFTCTMAFPWKPILSATGYTEYYFSKDSGKVCRHVEHWNVPKMALFKQLLKPSRQTNQQM